MLTLSTANGRGSPHAVMFCYVNDRLTFYVWTNPNNLTSSNIAINPAVSLTIGEYSLSWRSAKGVRATGHAAIVLDPAEIRHVHRLFAEKFPGLLPDPLRNLVFLRIRPMQLALVSNGAEGNDGDGEQATNFTP